MYPPTIARLGGKKKSLYIGSNAIYFIQGKPLDGTSYLNDWDGVVRAASKARVYVSVIGGGKRSCRASVRCHDGKFGVGCARDCDVYLFGGGVCPWKKI